MYNKIRDIFIENFKRWFPDKNEIDLNLLMFIHNYILC